MPIEFQTTTTYAANTINDLASAKFSFKVAAQRKLELMNPSSDLASQIQRAFKDAMFKPESFA